ncbi:hypothetical protein [Corallococcus exiguus]|uniref:hypothetical protein n=1 Tax=Corallococcus exiguus TaxID=83462 RepID=UPI00155FAF3C|nr:hypothetical protein [Corallococcus exiguus]NRD46044.1 hypothetical protein [Corallococcus exiguus]
MNRQTIALAFSVGMMFAGCGPEAARETETTEGQVHAMAPPDSCDPDVDFGWCRLSTDRVRCANGFYMYAYSTPDGWCIRYDACASQGGPYVCGLQ